MRKARAFTLVEILIVVVLLGVLAAIVIPVMASSGNAAKGSALATDLSLLRRFMVVYKSHHLEVPPGYPDGDKTAAPTNDAFEAQATLASNASGATAAVGTVGFKYGPYLSRIPSNPFNGLDTVQMLANGAAFPAAADGSHGWICKPETGEIRPDNKDSDENGKAYYDY
ncbi:MAG: prepilin-type N-terminal cleavage/methylation domain-containing protein [Sedimentisphaerales bacterium]|nr:prepilin-type N-terminal cleavage/methylation domain-containing protein [Sedimentisphaerales bacterium]